VQTLCGQGEFFSVADVRTFWRQKLRIFRNLWCVRTAKREWSWASATFCGQGGVEGSIFRDFVRMSFMDGP